MKLKTFTLFQIALIFSIVSIPNLSFSETAYSNSKTVVEDDLIDSKSNVYTAKAAKKKKKKFRLFNGNRFKKKLRKLSEKLQYTDPNESAKKCVNFASAGYASVLGPIILGNLGLGAIALICMVLSLVFPIVSISYGKKAKLHSYDLSHEEARRKAKLGINLSKVLLTVWLAAIIATWFFLTQINFD